MHKSTFAVVVVVVLTGLGVAVYVALRPAPTAAPAATSTAPVANTAEASSTPTPTVSPTTTLEQPNATTTPVVEQPMPPAPTATTTGFKTYRNEEWGFAFEYPENWEFKENTFGGYSSLFNIVLQSKEHRRPSWPITIMASFDDWTQRVFASVHKRGGTIATTTIQGFPASYFETEERGVPVTAYLLTFSIYLNHTTHLLSGTLPAVGYRSSLVLPA